MVFTSPVVENTSLLYHFFFKREFDFIILEDFTINFLSEAIFNLNIALNLCKTTKFCGCSSKFLQILEKKCKIELQVTQ